MDKKFKIAIPFAVLALTCGVSAGALAGCGKGHVHNYSDWKIEGNEHVKVCPDDGEKDETTRGGHVFVAGECECGAVEQTAEIKYGTASGQVKLYKLGENITDYTGVTVDMGDDDVETDYNEETGAFTIENVEVGKNYTLTVSKAGYVSYSATVEVFENENSVIGGTRGITLNYDVFTTFLGFDTDLHDMTRVNDPNPTIGVNGELDENGNGKKTLNVLTNDKYDDVSVTIKAKDSNAGVIQGLVLKFEDGKYAWVNIKTDQSLVQFRPDNKDWSVESVYGDNWKESAAGTVTQKHKDKFNGDGVDVTLTRKGGDMHVYVDGGLVYSITLPEGYEDDKVQAGLFAFSVKPNAVWEYEISDTVPAVGETTVDIDVDRTSDEAAAACDVTADKDKYVWGTDDEVTLTVTEAEGYKLERLLVNGNDLTQDLVDGKLTVKADRAVIKVEAEFAKIVPIELNLTIKGKKMGKTANLAEGTVVTFKGSAYSFTVGADGVISNPEVAKGTYTVSVDGYFEKQIVFDETLETIELEYDLFGIVIYDKESHDLSHVNEEDGYIKWAGSQATMNVVSKENMLGTAATISVTIKGGTSRDNAKEQGIIMRFEDGKAATVNINVDGDARLQFRPNVWGQLPTAFEREWVEFRNVTQAEVEKYNSDEGIVLKAIRDGKYIYVFIDDVYHATAVLPEQYADDNMGFGFFCSGVQVNNAEWHFTVTETAERAAATVTNKTAEGANGNVSGIPAAAKVGDEITLTLTAATGYKLSKLTVGGVDVTAQISGKTYTFNVAGDTDVLAEFVQIVPGSVNAQMTGYKFGVSENSLTAGAAVTLTSTGLPDVTAQITAVGDDLMLEISSIPAGTWTLNVEGYRPAQITVTENGEYVTAIVLQANEEFSLIKPWGNVNSVIAADGSAQLTITNESETAITASTYDDVAVTATLCTQNMIKNGKVGNQGIVFRFSDDKFIVLRLEGRAKIQFAYTEWYQTGDSADGTGWQDLIFFTDAGENTQKDKYLTALDEGKLQLTAVRKGATVHVILTVDGISEIIGSRTFDAKYSSDKAKVGMYVGDSANGPDKTWAFAVGDADETLAKATVAVGEDKTAYLGNWTDNEGKLGVTGKGLIEFKEQTGTYKESVTIHIAAANASNEQGIIYRFADGKYVAIRYQNSTDAATPHGKVQFTMDTVLFTNASLVGWTDYALTETEKTSFDGDGLDLTLMRDGNKFYVVLGERLLGTQTVNEGTYATANGNMGIMIWNGKEGAEFAYSHAAGDDVVVPQETVE